MFDCVAGEYYVTDLASTNGTFLDGEELAAGAPVKLEAGCELVLGAWLRGSGGSAPASCSLTRRPPAQQAMSTSASI